MSKYIIEMNKIEHDHVKNEVIEGKSPLKALEQRFLFPMKRIGQELANTADICMVKGYMSDNGNLKYQGRASRLYFKIDIEAI